MPRDLDKKPAIDVSRLVKAFILQRIQRSFGLLY
jgi:hypothetical protein